MDWFDACIALGVVGAVMVVIIRRWRKFAQTSSQWEAWAEPEEMSQTLLTNTKQEKMD
jgi:hypothetical protein